MSDRARADRKRVVVLGADGLDPGVLGELLEQGRLPTLARLAAAGGGPYRLGTSYPSASPVAWSSFISGKNPGGHGIYDFLERDRLTYLPRLALSRVKRGLFGWPTVVSNRQGGSFWEWTDRAGLVTSLMFLPVTFPPPKLSGRVLSGLGTPDIRGSWGTYTYFSSRLARSEETMMGGVLVPLELRGDEARAALEGPFGKSVDVTFRREIRGGAHGLVLTLAGRSEWVAEGEFSGWFEPVFRVYGVVPARGLCRLYVAAAGQHVEVYCSPVNMHPGGPPMAVGYPASESATAARRHGLYKTLGWDMDTWALEEERLSEAAFLKDLEQTIASRSAMLVDEVRRGDFDLFVGVMQETDLTQHVFWRYRCGADGPADHAGAIARVYQEVDRVASEMLSALTPGDTFLVLSDHGFGGFHRAVNLNSFLRDAGFLGELGGPAVPVRVSSIAPGRSPQVSIDWAKTRAYSYGLGNIWLNVRGREGAGIVDDGRDYTRTREQLAERLLGLRDPVSGSAAVRSVYFREQLYSGACFAEAPDILVGFHDGFRASWDAALGGVALETFAPNAGRWQGDHCSRDPAITPGVLLANRPLLHADPTLLDLAPTLLASVGCEVPRELEGRVLL
ncbi:MAG: alkaline phosphatase family protein [Candidatus Wallbacteria bacterium]|nr:alkaline phosphatase family protein [Candidatus Wallbacteria bacterium]